MSCYCAMHSTTLASTCHSRGLLRQRASNAAFAAGLTSTPRVSNPAQHSLHRKERQQHARPRGPAVASGFEDQLFALVNQMDNSVSQELTGITPITFLVILAAGLASSLSPCTLSVLPLTLGYIAGYGGSKEEQGNTNVILQAAAFSLGLATTLAALGVASSAVGKAYGSYGDGLPIAVSLVAILMGLNLLQVLQLQLPSLNVDLRATAVPRYVQAYLVGLTFALAASPCSTPILATLLAYVAQQQDLALGGALLLAYTTGYVAPLLLAATFAGALQQLLAMRKYSEWVTSASGTLLVAGGTYTLLSRLLPQ